MESFRSLKFSCFAFVVLIALSGQAFSSTVAVGNCTKLVQFATIQLAVNAVPSGSTVKVCPGTYAEQVTIANKNLTLIGTGPTASTVTVPASGLVTNGVTDIFGFPTAAQIFVQNATVTISHMAVDGANDQLTGCGVDAVGIYFKNAAGVITDNAVRNVLLPPGLQGCQDGLAINVESSTATAVTISNNSVRNYDKNGITASGPSGRLRCVRFDSKQLRS
jgi:pectin methylesterase-like acyl-CoA thioesterase